MIVTTRAALLLASASLLSATPAHAEDAGTTIVVTATKKSAAEDLQAVPLAVNAFDAATLKEDKVRAISDLTHQIPGVSLDQVGTFRGVANWSIRGLGINSSIASVDPAVGTFVDGIYLAINPGASMDVFDLKSIEVLRGPQGTLYGRNVTGGAVLLDTADPTHDWHFTVRGSGDGPVDGGRGAMNMTMSGVVSGPLADGLAFRLGAYHNSDGGYFRNLFNGGNYGKAETTVLRGGLLYESGPLRVVGKLEYLKTSGDGVVSQNHGLFARDTFDLSVNDEGFIRARSWFGTLRADYDLGGGKLTNVFGWRKFRQFTDNDIDSSPQTLFHSATGLTQHQWSDELRWAGKIGESFDLTLGGYLFHQAVAYEEDRRLPTTTPLTFYGGGTEGHDVQGLFAQGDWALTPTVTATAGLRWSHEKKDAAVTFVQTRTACSVIAGTCPITGTNPTTGAPNGFADDHAWSNWSPKLGLSWQASETMLAYASWSRAYRSGGYNLRVTQPAAFLANAALAGTPAYGEERVDSYEVGLKLQTVDKRGTLNLAAYRTGVKNMQREISVANGGSGLAQSIYNTANARIWGGEIEARYAVAPALTLSANASYIDAKYTHAFFDISGDNAIGPADLALALPRVPKWTYGATLRHELSLGDVSSLVSRVSFQHRSRYAYTDSNFGWVPSSDSLDADLTWKLPVKGWSLSVYGRNLLDQVQFGGDTQIPFGVGPFSDGNNRPFDPRPAQGTLSPLVKGRTLGVEAAVEF